MAYNGGSGQPYRQPAPWEQQSPPPQSQYPSSAPQQYPYPPAQPQQYAPVQSEQFTPAQPQPYLPAESQQYQPAQPPQYAPVQPQQPQQQHTLSHRISNLSDITDYENYHDHDPDNPREPLRGRESLVSLQSEYSRVQTPLSASTPGGYTYPSPSPSTISSWSGATFSYGGGAAVGGNQGGYEPVSVSGGVPPPRTTRTPSRGMSTLRRPPQHETIPEEEGYDLSLLRSAAPFGGADQYEPIQEERGNQDDEAPPAFDVTATLGPMTAQDEAFIKKLQEQERNGQLTGGLGAGLKIGTTMTSSDLLRSPMPARSGLVRRATNLRRSATVKGLGQEEANRRGEVIEVVMDGPADVDISGLVGPEGIDNRRSVASKEPHTQIFYPTFNWKPFSMRWPWLSMLIILSVALAVLQEIMFQRSTKEALIKFHRPSDVPPFAYFAIKFLPTFIAVTYGVLWQCVDFEVRRLEAYYQLSKEGGALAAESINVDYVSGFNFLRPFRALRMRHYAVTISSFASFLAVSLVPTFSAASIILTPDRGRRTEDPNGEKLILINAIWSRFLTGTLCVCAVFACMLLYLLQSRKSGLMADVKGIAGLASLANKSHILVDFENLDTVRHTDLHQRLKHHRYVLRNASLAPDDENPVSTKDKGRFLRSHLSENPHPLMLRAAGCVPFIISILLFAGFIPTFLFTPATIVTDHAPWLVTALAVCIKLSWVSLETDVRMMEPFFILSKRHAPSVTLTLDYTAMPFGYLPVRAFFNRHYLMTLVGFGSVMAEVLTILLTSLATVEGRDFIGVNVMPTTEETQPDEVNSGQETPLSFWISFCLALFILVYLCVMATVVFVRRRHPFLPRQPNTIASILAYIHQSKMLYDFVNTEKFSNDQMVEELEKLGKTYGLGWFEGRDGQSHCGVDYEELISNYKHGIDFSEGNKPWNSQWDRY